MLKYCADTRSVSIVKKTTFPVGKQVPVAQALTDLHDRYAAFLAPLTIDIYLREKTIMGHFADTDRLLRVAGITDIVLWRYKHKQYFDIAPSSVKLLVAGSGSARKEGVARAVELYVGPQEYATNDESDAVAIGLAFLIKEGYIDSRIEIQRKPKLKQRPEPKIVPKPDVKPGEKRKRKRKPPEPSPTEKGYIVYKRHVDE